MSNQLKNVNKANCKIFPEILVWWLTQLLHMRRRRNKYLWKGGRVQKLKRDVSFNSYLDHPPGTPLKFSVPWACDYKFFPGPGEFDSTWNFRIIQLGISLRSLSTEALTLLEKRRKIYPLVQGWIAQSLAFVSNWPI